MSTLLNDIDRARSARRQYEDDLALEEDADNNAPITTPVAAPRRRVPRRQPSRYFDPPPAATTTDTDTDSSSNSSLTAAARHPPAYLLERHHDDDGPFHRRHLTPREFRDAIPLAAGAGARRLLVLQGLTDPGSGAYVEALRGSEALRMDDEFLEAHAAGRGYRGGRRWGAGWGYPEVVGGGRREEGVWELGGEGLGVVFCRASVWEAPGCVAVVVVDRPVWEGDGGVRRVRRRSFLGGEEGYIPCLEDVLRKGGHQQVHQLLVDAILDRWLTLFEHLPPPTPTGSRDTTLAHHQILHALSQNIPTTPTLSPLLPLLQTRLSLLSPPPPPSLPLGLSTTSSSAARAAAARIPPPRRTGRELLDENHRALDRISYLGGVLLPLPVVSGVLSMTDAYSPDGARFWVFWAAAVPLSVVAVCVIYADTIRKAEVWVEVKGGQHEAGTEKPRGSWARFWKGEERKGGGDEEAVPAAGGPVCAVPHGPPGGEKVEEPQTLFPMFLSLGAGGGGFVGVEPEAEGPEMIVEEPGAGRRGRAWKRKRLGWGGAARAILYEKPRYCDKHMPKGFEGVGRSQSY
ncbi:hypothetical protein QBC39DRAFT_371285 [Podospora conica]|nr:hypothetical protein QBC39DRAFT_371285 [Schizothecium conicum]